MPTRPLAQTRSDQRLFVDRAEETKELLRCISGSQPVLVLSEPGSGRTSLLNHVAWRRGRETPRQESVLSVGNSRAIRAAARSAGGAGVPAC